MKTKKSKQQSTGPQKSKGKVKLKNLELHKETIQNLSDQNLSDTSAEAVRGGADLYTRPGGGARYC